LETEVRGWFEHGDVASRYQFAMKTMDSESRKVIDAVMVEAFRAYVLGHLEPALDILVALNTVIGSGDDMFVQCKRLFLRELYRLEVEKYGQTDKGFERVLDESLFGRLVGLYRRYIKEIKSDPYVAKDSDAVYAMIKRILSRGVGVVETSRRSPKTRGPKIKTEVMEDLSELRREDPEMKRMLETEEAALAVLR
jgi:hypothetical protein